MMREYKYAQNAELERYSNSILRMDQINDIQEHAGNAQGVDPLANQIDVANVENDNQAWNALVEENSARALLQCGTIRIRGKDYLIPTGIDKANNFIVEMEDARQTNITALRAANVRQSDPLGVTTSYKIMWKLAEANQLTALPHILDTLIYQTQYDDSNVPIFFDTMLEPGEPQHDNGGIEWFGLRVPPGMNVSTAIKVWSLLYRMCENSQYAHAVHDFLEKYQNKTIVIDTMWKLASNNTIILNSCYISFSKFAKRNSECSEFFLDALFKINNNIFGNNPQLEQINRPQGMLPTRALSYSYLIGRINEDAEHRHLMFDWIEDYPENGEIFLSLWEFMVNNLGEWENYDSYYRNFSEFAKRNRTCANLFLNALFQLNNNIVGNNPQLEQINRPEGMLPTRALNYSYLIGRMNEDAEHRHLMFDWIEDYPGNGEVFLSLWEFMVNNLGEWENYDSYYRNFSEFAKRNRTCANLFLDALFRINSNIVGNNPQLEQIQRPQGMGHIRALNCLYLIRRMNEDAEHRHLMLCWIKDYPRKKQALKTMWKFSIKNTQILGHSYNTFAEFALHGDVCSNLFFDTLFGVNMRRGLNNFPQMDTLQLPQEMSQSTAIGLLYILNHTSRDFFHLADVIGWLRRYRNRKTVLEDMRDLVNLNLSLNRMWRVFMVDYNNKKTYSALLR